MFNNRLCNQTLDLGACLSQMGYDRKGGRGRTVSGRRGRVATGKERRGVGKEAPGERVRRLE